MSRWLIANLSRNRATLKQPKRVGGVQCPRVSIYGFLWSLPALHRPAQRSTDRRNVPDFVCMKFSKRTKSHPPPLPEGEPQDLHERAARRHWDLGLVVTSLAPGTCMGGNAVPR